MTKTATQSNEDKILQVEKLQDEITGLVSEYHTLDTASVDSGKVVDPNKSKKEALKVKIQSKIDEMAVVKGSIKY